MSLYEVNIYPNGKSPKLFKNRFFEKLTKTHPLVILVMYFILGFFLLRYYHIDVNISWGNLLGLFMLGLLSWTLAEYLMHRFLYHRIGDASFSSGIHYVFHGIHHEYPNDEDRLILPPVPSLIIASVFFLIFYLLMADKAFAFAPGFLIGYVLYMMVHYTIHKVPMPKKFNFWWKHHNIHHFQQHDRAFGVSTPLWDYVFRTMPEKNRKTVKIIKL